MAQQSSPSGKTITLYTIGDAMEVGLTQDYLVKGLIEPGTLNLMYGEPSCGKSFVALHIAFCVANAKPVLGKRVRAARVLYVALEGERAFCRRIQAAVLAMKQRKERPTDINFFYVTEHLNLLNGTGHVEALVATAQQINARLIFLDTFARALGPGSENDQIDMGAMIEAFDYIRLQTGAALVVVHHCGKDSTKGPRGHSSLMAAADTAIEVARDDTGRQLRIAKCKDGIDGEAVTFSLDVISLGTDQDGDLVTSCAVTESSKAPSRTGKPPSLTPDERGWLQDITNLFTDVPSQTYVTPRDGMPDVQVLTRDEVRNGLKSRGRFNLDERGNLTESGRKTFERKLNSLRDKGRVGMTDRYIWLLKSST